MYDNVVTILCNANERKKEREREKVCVGMYVHGKSGARKKKTESHISFFNCLRVQLRMDKHERVAEKARDRER